MIHIKGYPPMDEQTADFLAKAAQTAAAGGGNRLAEMALTDIRSDYELRLTADAAQAPEMAAIREYAVSVAGRKVTLRLYDPTGKTGMPVILFMHGGGFVKGSLESHDCFCRGLAKESGLPVVAVDYRLAPEVRYPGAMQDCIAALEWLTDGAELDFIDSSRVIVAGDSAGGQLAAALALYARDKRICNVCGQILFYPCLDMMCSGPSHTQCATGCGLTEEAVIWYYDQYLPEGADKANPELSPVYAANLGGVAPAGIFNAVFDPVRSDGELYATALKEAGNDVELHLFPTVHGFASMYVQFAQGKNALVKAGAFARRVTGIF
ncbi:alpha/beta hydrolase [Oleidesulfovibrio sp.]|uniref:alpha/beta hydrolase n=1 Tax=Oleidesulfovibrio sp. TaxID=2909707 RepID=UPI003A89D077